MSAIGTYRLTDLSEGQCRFSCSEEDGEPQRHRFCGAQTFIGPGNLHGSWCPEHLKIVWGSGTREEQRAGDWEHVRRVA